MWYTPCLRILLALRLHYDPNTYRRRIVIKTRDQIYGHEAHGILRDISMYRALTESQLLGLYPGKEKQILNLLSFLVRQGRIFKNETGLYTASSVPEEYDRGLSAALWVLIDFIDQVDFHSTSDFPAKIIFFARDEVYEIIYVAYGQEALVSHILSELAGDPPNYIVLVDKQEQIASIEIPNVSGYCTVSQEGHVQYFQKEEGACH